jgi:hypothetical protein
MANSAALGTAGVPFPLLIERGEVKEFAAAARSENPAYYPRQGRRGGTLTFASMVTE